MAGRIQSIWEKRQVGMTNGQDTFVVTEEVTETVTERRSPPSHLFDKIAQGFLFALIFLLPLFFVPLPGLPILSSKGFLLMLLTFLSLFFFLLARLRTKSFSFPQSAIGYGLILFLLATLCSSFVGDSSFYSLFGRGIVINSFLLSFTFVALARLSIFYLSTRRNIQLFLLTFGVVFILVFLFQILRIAFGVHFLSFGYFTNAYASLFGEWFDLPTFFGLSALISYLTFRFLWKDRLFRRLSLIVLFLSLLFLIFFPLDIVFITLAVLFFLIFLYEFMGNRGSMASIKAAVRMHALPLFLILLSLLFVFFGTQIGGTLAKTIGMNNSLQARPSLSTTVDIYQNTFEGGIATKIFGTAPGSFFKDWAKYKPDAINETPWWNSDFSQGASFLTTKAITLGIFGILSLLLLLVGILYEGIRGYRRSLPGLQKSLFLVLYLPLLYLWSMLLFYTPGVVMIAFGFLYLGMVLGYLSHENLLPTMTFRWRERQTRGARFVLPLLFLFVLVSLGGIYLSVEHYRGAYLAQAGVIATNQNDVAKAEPILLSATHADEVDSYYRELAQIGVLKMRAIETKASSGEGGIDTTDLQKIFEETIANAQKAKDLDPGNYQNYLFLGDLYRFFASVGVQGAYAESQAYYSKVLGLMPSSPTAYLGLARLEMTQNNTSAAKTYLKQALSKKSNYADAYLEQAQIALEEKDTAAASDALTKAASLVGNDPSLWFQLGLLEYQTNDFSSAEQAFKNALVLVPNYSNAEYYLGLSYEKNGAYQQALEIFQQLAKENPGNQDVAGIITRLKSEVGT